MDGKQIMKLESKKEVVAKDINSVFDFLKDTRNIYQLLPQDKISDWQADEKSCSFKVQGGVLISFEQVSLEEPTKIFLKSGEKSPFPFTLTVNLQEIDNKTEGFLSFDGEVNLFLKMLVEKPLQNLFDFMSQKLKEHFEE
jgi:carbon monoxide dehydrogenase subunit G